MNEQNSNFPPNPPYPYYPYPPKKKSRWWIPVLIIGVIFLFFIIIVVGFFSSLGSAFEQKPVEVKDNSVLYLNLPQIVQEYTQTTPFDFISNHKQSSFLEILTTIHRAKTDPKIKGIYYKATMSMMGFAKAQELQAALEDFRSSGKFIYAYIEYGREMDYYYALPADKIFMAQEGVIEMNGFGTSTVFLKGLFDYVGIDFHVLGFEDFKSAAESLSRKNFSDSAKLQLRVVLNQRHAMFVESIAKFRKIAPEKINEALNKGVYCAEDMLSYGFIDGIASESEVKDMIKQIMYGKIDDKQKINLIRLDNYTSAPYKDKNTKVAPSDKKIAIVYAAGEIVEQVNTNPFQSTAVITSKDFIRNLKKAREDDDVKIIILRINSPGGSVIASDVIRQEVLKTKKIKPIIASMGDVAASGGYYIPMACDTIVAHPATITGSIGVILAVPNVTRLIEKIHVTADSISTTESAQFMNGTFPVRDKDKEQIYGVAKRIYDRFVSHVAEHRHKTFDEARALAKGRVWTGEDAKKHGLVDILGGFEDAIKLAKKKIGVPEDMKVQIVSYPEPEEDLAAFMKIFGLEKDNDEESSSEASVDYTQILSELFGVKKEAAMASFSLLPMETQHQLSYFIDLFNMSRKEKVIAAMPYYFEVY